MTTTHTPRSAIILLTQAFGHVDRVQPPSIRPALAKLLLSAMEQCVGSRTISGKQLLEEAIDLAQALTDPAAVLRDDHE